MTGGPVFSVNRLTFLNRLMIVQISWFFRFVNSYRKDRIRLPVIQCFEIFENLDRLPDIATALQLILKNLCLKTCCVSFFIALKVNIYISFIEIKNLIGLKLPIATPKYKETFSIATSLISGFYRYKRICYETRNRIQRFIPMEF